MPAFAYTRRSGQNAISERQLQDGVVELARALGYKVMHTRPAQNSQGEWATPLQGSPGFVGQDKHCKDCHGTGQLWDEGLVEVVAKALFVGVWLGADFETKELYRRKARAVLVVLAEEAGR